MACESSSRTEILEGIASSLAGLDMEGVKKGDKILFGKYAGDEWKSDGDEYLFLSDDEILAIL